MHAFRERDMKNPALWLSGATCSRGQVVVARQPLNPQPFCQWNGVFRLLLLLKLLDSKKSKKGNGSSR